MSTERVTVMLAGPSSDAVTYQFTPPFMNDPRFLIVNSIFRGSDLRDNLLQYKPQVLIVRSDIMPAVSELIDAISRMSVWQGVAIVIVPSAHRDIAGSFDRVSTVRGVCIEPVNWGEIVQKAFSEVLTERAKQTSAVPLQQSYVSRQASAVTGSRVVAFLGATGGVGTSTIAEGVAWHLHNLNIRTLLCSFNQPPAAVPHLHLSFIPNALECFYRPADGFPSAIQQKDGLDVMMAPERTKDYAEIASQPSNNPNSVYSIVMGSWTRGYAATLLDLPHGEGAWTLQSIAAANTAVIIARPTLADMAAVNHLLTLLLDTMSASIRISRESIYLVLNQFVPEKSSFSAAQFFTELAAISSWVPQVIATIPFMPSITQLQDRQTSPVGSVAEFTDGMRRVSEVLFPGMGSGEGEVKKKGFKLGPIRLS